MSDVKPCHKCGREPKVRIVIGSGWLLACEPCNIQGSAQESHEKAVAAWNAEPPWRAWIREPTLPNDRLVMLRVTDPDVTHVDVSFVKEDQQTFERKGTAYLPVPEDDQLREDIMALSEWAEANYRQAIHGAHEQLLRPYVEAARRLRVAGGLDQEDDNE